MKFDNILEAIFAAPAIMLEQVIEGGRSFLFREKELIEHGEFEDETEE